MMPHTRHLPSLILLAVALGVHLYMWRRVVGVASDRRSPLIRWFAGAAAIALAGLLVAGFSLGFTRVILVLPPGAYVAWLRAAALGWALACPAACLALWIWLRPTRFSPERRRLIRAAGGAVLASPFAAGGYGAFLARSHLDVREVEISLPGLPKELDGLRMAQLTDIHLGPFLSRKELARAVDAANGWRAHLGAVTGDLITDRGGPLEECLQELARLRATEGLYGCTGNHEGYAGEERSCASRGARLGIEFLRFQSRELRFGDAVLNLAGVDYQAMGGPYLTGADRLVRAGNFNVLLSHNPDVFPMAARRGFQLVLAGHTHGGQLAFEAAGIPINAARLFTRYVRGLYRENDAAVYVSRGIGTVGVPMRLGAPPEVTLIRLCAS